MQTSETMDKLYLEYSEVTKARTWRDLKTRELLKRVYAKLHMGCQKEPDSKIAEDVWNYLNGDDMGAAAFDEWAENYEVEY